MDNNNRQFNLEFKAVAIVLVLAIFATLIPARVCTNAYAEEPSTTLLDPDCHVLSEYYANSEDRIATTEMSQNDRFSEYEQLLPEKLRQPVTVAEIDSYKRSDASYQKTDLVNAFTRDYALRNGNYARLVFGSPVN